MKQTLIPIESMESRIHFVRGQRVMLDADLAIIYGAALKALNQQVRRNRDRFPADFAFQLTRQEVAGLVSEFAVASSGHGGRRMPPWAFTEHGAIMLATVLNSPIAVEASVRVVRAFVHLREMLASNRQLAAKFAELERRLDGHDKALKTLFDTIRELLNPSQPDAVPPKELGFHVKEPARRYRVSRIE